jgi:ubiquinone/menaquinone biosynthesis C-methylase UbiE
MGRDSKYVLSGAAAEMYERNMVPAFLETFARDLLDRAGLVQGESILDVACGTGIVSRLAWPMIAPSGRIVGLDANAEMLGVAEDVSRDLAANIEWTESDVCQMPLPDGAFDVILCQHGLQYFPDRPAALKEMHRVLGGKGRLILNVWRPVKFNPGHAVFADVLERRVNAEAAATRRSPFILSD